LVYSIRSLSPSLYFLKLLWTTVVWCYDV
jgi:hypothetical protein